MISAQREVIGMRTHLISDSIEICPDFSYTWNIAEKVTLAAFETYSVQSFKPQFDMLHAQRKMKLLKLPA